MNYLFIMPKLIESNDEAYVFPVGIAYVVSAIKQTNRNIHTLNLNYKKGSIKSIISSVIIKEKIDVIAVGGLTRQYNEIITILQECRAVKPDIVTIVGGGIITSSPVEAMEALRINDYGIIGEGEITICELADAIEGKKKISEVAGIIYKLNNNWEINQLRKEIADLDALPFPDYEGFDFGETLKRKTMSAQFGGALAYIISSRSCPYNCTFCFHPSGSTYRMRSIENVFEEIDWLVEKYPEIQNIRLNDELFGLNKKFLIEFCKGMKKRKLGFSAQMRVDNISKEVLEILKESGCQSINLGLESANNDILKSMKKNITIEQIENALELALEVGIPARGSFIFGDPQETYETAMQTLNWWRNHRQYFISLSNIIVYPGTYLYKDAIRRKIIKDPIQFIKDGCPQINVSNMSDKEYRSLNQEINKLINGSSSDKLEFVSFHYEGAGRVNLEGDCPYCGEKNKWTDLSVFTLNSTCVCKKCHKNLKILVSDYIGTIAEDNFNVISIDNKKIAIWPMSMAVVNALAKIPSILKENIFIIDSSTLKQGTEFEGKIIYSPDILDKEKIDTVFIANNYVAGKDIINTIKRKYKTVNHIFNIDELVDKELIHQY